MRIRARWYRILCRNNLHFLFCGPVIYQLASHLSSTEGIIKFLCCQVSLLSRSVLCSSPVTKEGSYTHHYTTNASHLLQRNHQVSTPRIAHVPVTAIHFKKLHFTVDKASSRYSDHHIPRTLCHKTTSSYTVPMVIKSCAQDLSAWPLISLWEPQEINMMLP